jgi:hypothetical protein
MVKILNDMKTIGFVLCFSILLSNCNKLFKDEELSLKRVSYIGNELKTNGYYYSYYTNKATPPETYTVAFFLYRNGVMLSARAYESINLDTVEKKMLKRYESLREEKIGWGVFVVKDNKIEYEQWSTSAGGGLPVFKNSYIIENDSTLTNLGGNIYHFRQFSPKPDSTSNFIK